MTATATSVPRAYSLTRLPDDEEIFAPVGTEADDAVEPPEDDERLLKLALEPLLRSYDFIVIDCPPTLGILTTVALTAADGVLIPLHPSLTVCFGDWSSVQPIDADNVFGQFTVVSVVIHRRRL